VINQYWLDLSETEYIIIKEYRSETLASNYWVDKSMKNATYVVQLVARITADILYLYSITWITYNGSLYLSVTAKFYTKVLHQTLNPTAELWCKTLSRIMFGVKHTTLLFCSSVPVGD